MRYPPPPSTEFELHYHGESQSGLGVIYSQTGMERSSFWFPKSQVTVVEEVNREIHRVRIPNWLALSRGFLRQEQLDKRTKRT